MPKALITGVTGQDGSYLTELLLSKGYEVHGLCRSTDTVQGSYLAPLFHDSEVYNKQLFFHDADLNDPSTMREIVVKVAPDEIYHLAAQSHVGRSFEDPEGTCEIAAMGTLRLLEVARAMPKQPKFFHASSSEIFGNPAQCPQTLETPIAPVNPYGCAKTFATQMVQVYRR